MQVSDHDDDLEWEPIPATEPADEGLPGLILAGLGQIFIATVVLLLAIHIGRLEARVAQLEGTVDRLEVAEDTGRVR